MYIYIYIIYTDKYTHTHTQWSGQRGKERGGSHYGVSVGMMMTTTTAIRSARERRYGVPTIRLGEMPARGITFLLYSVIYTHTHSFLPGSSHKPTAHTHTHIQPLLPDVAKPILIIP